MYFTKQIAFSKFQYLKDMIYVTLKEILHIHTIKSQSIFEIQCYFTIFYVYVTHGLSNNNEKPARMLENKKHILYWNIKKT